MKRRILIMRLIDADRLIEEAEPELRDDIKELTEKIPTVYPMFTGRTSGKTVLNEYMAMCNTLENYGISANDPFGNLTYVLEQYQKLICELTHSRLSKLTYNATDVIALINDLQNDDIEKAVKEALTEQADKEQ
jgi:hypothetical protein